MIEGKLYYDEEKDYWYIIKEDDSRVIVVSELIYGLSNHGSNFDDELYIGEGEHFKLTLEINGKVANTKRWTTERKV